MTLKIPLSLEEITWFVIALAICLSASCEGMYSTQVQDTYIGPDSVWETTGYESYSSTLPGMGTAARMAMPWGGIDGGIIYIGLSEGKFTVDWQTNGDSIVVMRNYDDTIDTISNVTYLSFGWDYPEVIMRTSFNQTSSSQGDCSRALWQLASGRMMLMEAEYPAVYFTAGEMSDDGEIVELTAWADIKTVDGNSYRAYVPALALMP